MKVSTSPSKTNRFLAIRERFGITQQEAADLLHVTQLTWYNWESGNTEPRGAMLFLLEQFESKLDSIPILSYADKCKLLRQSLGSTKLEMAFRFNIWPATWIDWESGKRRPRLEERAKIDQMLADVEASKLTSDDKTTK